MMWLVPLLLAVLLASGLGLAYVVQGARSAIRGTRSLAYR